MTDTIKTPATNKELRQFGLIFAGITSAISTAIALLTQASVSVWAWASIALIGLLALAAPATLRPFYRAWMWLGDWLQWINTRVVLSLLFYLIITPTGLVMRLFGYDPMQRNNNADSYRTVSQQRDPNHVEKPY